MQLPTIFEVLFQLDIQLFSYFFELAAEVGISFWFLPKKVGVSLGGLEFVVLYPLLLLLV